jgi:hypothetical protein
MLDQELGSLKVEQWAPILVEPKHDSRDNDLTGIRSDQPGNMSEEADGLECEGRADLGAGAVVDNRGIEREGEGIARLGRTEGDRPAPGGVDLPYDQALFVVDQRHVERGLQRDHNLCAADLAPERIRGRLVDVDREVPGLLRIGGCGHQQAEHCDERDQRRARHERFPSWSGSQSCHLSSFT